MLACSGVAAVCWQSINRRERKLVNVLGLGLALLCALNLTITPSSFSFRSGLPNSLEPSLAGIIDWSVWTALTAPLLVLPLYMPIIHMSAVISGVPVSITQDRLS